MMFKKLSVLLFCFCAIIFTSAETFASDGVNYKTTSSSTVEVGPNGAFTGDLIIPLTVSNNGTTYDVTSIGAQAFFFDSHLTSVKIPNSVTSIGQLAFLYCSGLTSLTIPTSVTSIGSSAFFGCSGLTSLTLPNSVTSIGSSSFANCSGLTSLTIPNSVTSIGSSSFANCSGLTSLTIPTSVTSIESSTFFGCSGLTSLTLPNSVTSIGSSSFANCSGLTSLTIPNSVTSIGNSAFFSCSGLTFVICDIVTPLTIDASVFQNVVQNNCSLTVPPSSVAAYQAANVWKNFNPITDGTTLNTSNFINQNKVNFYPNPIHNEAVLELKNSDNSQLEVYDMNGKAVLKKSLNNNAKNTINTSNLSSGIYLK